MAATLDRISGGRLLINVVTGGDPVELKGDGLFLDHGARYEVTDEFLRDLAPAAGGRDGRLRGQASAVEGGQLFFPPVQQPYPPLYFGGSSRGRHEIAAEQVDVYLTWGEPPGRRGREDRRMSRRAAAARGPPAALRHPPARHRAGDRGGGLGRRPSELIAPCRRRRRSPQAQEVFARMDSVGQQRMAALHGGRRDQLEISPNLWAGVGLVRGGAGTALVGDPETVAARMKEYMALGHRDASSCPATRIWRKATASPSWCSRCCRSKATTGRDRRDGPQRRPVRRDDRQRSIAAAAQQAAGGLR